MPNAIRCCSMLISFIPFLLLSSSCILLLSIFLSIFLSLHAPSFFNTTTTPNSSNRPNSKMSFTWSATFVVGATIKVSKGDKIILPQAALESIIQANSSAPPPPPPELDPSYDPTSWEDHPQHNYNPFNATKSQELQI